MSDDRHPEELLAGYVDGTLTDEERAVVETHLTACDRCREESALAMRAVDALGEIPDVPVPVGVTGPVIREVRERAARTRPRTLSQRVVWAAGGAIAAAFVGLVAIWVLPNLGGGALDTGGAGAVAPAQEAQASRSAALGGGAEFAGRPVALEHVSTNFDDAALQRLADAEAAAASDRVLGRPTDNSTAGAATRTATGCLTRGAGTEPQDVLVRLIDARYRGRPALIGVYLTGPSPGGAPDKVLVWVVRRDGCEFASYTQDRI